jgi:hypothetical protein
MPTPTDLDAPGGTPAGGPGDGTVAEPLAMSWTIGRVLVVLAVLAMVGFWAWIFAGGPRQENQDRLDDRRYVARIEQRCRTARADLAKLPNAASIDRADERADVLDDANVIVTAMVDDLERWAPKTGDDGQSVRGWIKDWRTYLKDRRAFADALRKDPDARLLLDLSPLGDSVDKTIQVFTQVNEMPACDTPGDVG